VGRRKHVYRVLVKFRVCRSRSSPCIHFTMQFEGVCFGNKCASSTAHQRENLTSPGKTASDRAMNVVVQILCLCSQRVRSQRGKALVLGLTIRCSPFLGNTK
jgi:hypothetical protein